MQRNVKQFKEEKKHYIVGARLGNLSQDLINEIHELLARQDGKTVKIKTVKGFLIYVNNSEIYNSGQGE